MVLYWPLVSRFTSIDQSRGGMESESTPKIAFGGGLDGGADLGVSSTEKFGVKTSSVQQKLGGSLEVLNALNLFGVKDAVSGGVVIKG